jgi:histidine triad (HIT) family protein
MENCVFCKIAKGEIPSYKVWEDGDFFAFLDMSPVRPGHTLVIPKKHEKYIFDLSDKDYSGLMLASKKVAGLLKEKLHPKRVGMLVEGFGVDHVHVHLIPIDGGAEIWLGYSKKSAPEELKKVAKQIIE